MEGFLEERKAKKESLTLRVWGPYQENPIKFRIKVSEGGQERNLTFRSQAEAESVKEALIGKSAQIKMTTVGAALKEWSQHLADFQGLKESSAMWVMQVSRYWLPLDMAPARINEADAKRIYMEHVVTPCPRTKKPPAAATHHEQLLLVRRFWDWCIEQGYCRHNPWKSVRKVGKKSKGKPQLRIDEARQLESVALRKAQEGERSSLGILLMIYLGLRQGEVAARVARDVDDEGRILWIPSGKTENAKRRLRVPPHLQPLLLRLARSHRPEERIFYAETSKLHHSYYVTKVKLLCQEAGVPVVVPHSLRGLHATLALDGGATADAVARALGHGSFAITKQHYASASSVDNARAEKVAEALTPKPSSDSEMLALLLKATPPDQLHSLLRELIPRLPHDAHRDETPPL